jgi:hypothetical protein
MAPFEHSEEAFPPPACCGVLLVMDDWSESSELASSSSSPVVCGSSVWLSVLRSLWNFHAFWMRPAQ